MINDFISNQKVLEITGRAEKLKISGKRYSDVEDAQGNQYVDLVQEGGGVLGIALVGYTYILEKAGIRFFSLAGTSAGAINTMMIAGMGKIGEPVSEKILEILSNKNLFDIVDGDKAIKKLIQKAVENEKGLKWSIAWNAIKIYKTLKNKLGINPGNDFEQWISDVLKINGVVTLSDLINIRKQLPEGIRYIVDEANSVFETKLAIISSEITTHTKAEFPRMAELYWENPLAISPSKFVRASMSIPFFFTPFQVGGLPNAGKTEQPQWDVYAKYSGKVPDSVKFVDGGMLSNFPINVFHVESGIVPRMPTFGARLSTYRESYSNTDSIFGLSGAMISTMRQIYDYDFLLKNPDYSKLICRIDADQKFNWLNFNMTKEEQIELFTLGAVKAIEFLDCFDWDGYKKIRMGNA
jgi:NTE family protein